MRFKIDIWKTEMDRGVPIIIERQQNKVDKKLHDGEASTAGLGWGSKHAEISLDDFMLTSCKVVTSSAVVKKHKFNADATYTVQQKNLVSGQAENLAATISGTAGNFLENMQNVAPVDFSNNMNSTFKNAMTEEQGYAKNISIELAGYLYRPEETYEDTIELMKWAGSSLKHSEVQRELSHGLVAQQAEAAEKSVLLRVVNHRKMLLAEENTYRIVYLPSAHVESYSENYDTAKGVGTFAIKIVQDSVALERVVIAAPAATRTLLRVLSGLGKAVKGVANAASTILTYTSSAMILGGKVAELFGAKSEGFNNVVNGMKDAGNVIGSIGGVMASATDRTLSKTERANKAAAELNAIGKGMEGLGAQVDKEGWKKNAEDDVKKEAAITAAVKKADALKKLEENKKAYDDFFAVKPDAKKTNLKESIDKVKAKEKAIAAIDQKVKAAKAEVKEAKKNLLMALGTGNETEINNAKKDLAEKSTNLQTAMYTDENGTIIAKKDKDGKYVGDSSAVAAQKALKELQGEEKAAYNNLSDDDKTEFKSKRDAYKQSVKEKAAVEKEEKDNLKAEDDEKEKEEHVGDGVTDTTQGKMSAEDAKKNAESLINKE